MTRAVREATAPPSPGPAIEALSPARRELFHQHVPLVESIAAYEERRLGWLVGRDDLIQEGALGLLKACATFEPEVARRTGRTFEQWAKLVIRRAMRKAFRTAHRHEGRVLRAAQEAATESTLYCARAADPFRDSDDGVKELFGETVNAAMGAHVACLCGGLLRAPGEEGVLLRLEYARLLAAVAEERAKLPAFEAWVLGRKYEDGLTWDEIAALAQGRTRDQIRYAHRNAVAALGEALRRRGHDDAPAQEGLDR
jgi:RNA polymerase sigma factor (sigma-70 family)